MLGGATSLKLACNAVDGQCQGEEDNQVLLQPTIPPPLGLPSHATYYSQESMSFLQISITFLPSFLQNLH